MQKFAQEFHTLNYSIKEADHILLFIHSRPDGDTIGSAMAIKEYAKTLGKNADIACYDSLPKYLEDIISEQFLDPKSLDISRYKLTIACDSVERGFEKIFPFFKENQITALIDHHPDITISGDITIIDPVFSSTCELIYEFFVFNKIEITRPIATYLLLGILGDTGMLQHSSTTSHVLEISSELLKKGASLSKIVDTAFSNKNICTLRLWGKAFEKAKINPKNGMIASVLTREDLEKCQAGTEDIAQVATILNTVPGSRFSLILSEREGGIVKGSLRSEEYKGVDVSKIAANFGGGGHKLASGFELKGKIVETKDGWKIV
jgi:bifunctional oligoribonuclease and PAP phosphatase NrnA